MHLRPRVAELALAVLALSTALAFVLALVTWWYFDWPETAQVTAILSLANASIALVSLCVCLLAIPAQGRDPSGSSPPR